MWKFEIFVKSEIAFVILKIAIDKYVIKIYSQITRQVRNNDLWQSFQELLIPRWCEREGGDCKDPNLVCVVIMKHCLTFFYLPFLFHSLFFKLYCHWIFNRVFTWKHFRGQSEKVNTVNSLISFILFHFIILLRITGGIDNLFQLFNNKGSRQLDAINKVHRYSRDWRHALISISIRIFAINPLLHDVHTSQC